MPQLDFFSVVVSDMARSPEDVNRVYAELLQAGGSAHKEPWHAFWGQRYAQVKDPDGTVLDLYAPLPDAGAA